MEIDINSKVASDITFYAKGPWTLCVHIYTGIVHAHNFMDTSKLLLASINSCLRQ